jgi:hypothetical protein
MDASTITSNIQSFSATDFDPEKLLRAMEQDGVVTIRGVIPVAEALGYRDQLTELIQLEGSNQTWESGDPEAKRVLALHDVHTFVPFQQLWLDPRLLQPVSVLLGGAVRWHHAKGHLKPAGDGDKFGIHQDVAQLWTRNPLGCMAGTLNLTPNLPGMGGLRLNLGSHKLGVLPTTDGQLTDPAYIPQGAVFDTTYGEPGDFTLFTSLTLHDSPPNESDEDRLILLFQYMSLTNQVVLPKQHPAKDQGRVIYRLAA